MGAVLENILIMILTIVFLLGGGYLLLVIFDWGLKLKAGRREQEGLTDLWITSQTNQPKATKPEKKSRIDQ